MKAITAVFLCSALAQPVFAGQGSIVETDDAYIVEYSSDSAEKPVEKEPARPAAIDPVAVPRDPAPPQTASPPPAAEGVTGKPHPERVRDPSRKARTLGLTPPNDPGNVQQ